MTRAGNVAVSTTVAWAVAGGVDAADFGGTLPSGVASFASGETSKLVSFSATSDETIEPNEAFTVTLGSCTGNGAILGDTTSASFTITDDDTAPVIHIVDSVRMSEGNSGSTAFSFTLSRVGNSGKASEVLWSFAHGSTDTADFSGGNPAPTGRVTFAPGLAHVTVSFQVAGDVQIEGSETFFVDITPLSFGTSGNTRAVGYIESDDVNNTFTLAAREASAAEGAAGTQRAVEFAVTRSGNTTAPASVIWERSGTVTNDDLAAGTVTGGAIDFAAGQTTATLRLTVQGDNRIEGDETLTVTLLGTTGLGAGLGTTVQASTTITTDDPKGVVTVALGANTPASTPEGNNGGTVHAFTLTRNGDLTDSATLNWAITGSANAADFQGNRLPSGTASFAAGSATTTVSVTTLGDIVFEADETLTLTLSEGDRVTPSGTQGSATVTLTNDDEPNEYRIKATNASQMEGSSLGASTSFRFEVSRLGELRGGSSVELEVVPSGANPVNGADFRGGTLPKFSVVWSTGETSRVVFIDVLQDQAPEADETFTVRLQNSVGADVSASQGEVLVTVLTDEALPQLAVTTASVQVNEGNSGLTPITFTVLRYGDLTAASSATWTLGGVATASDLATGQAMSGTVSFAANEFSKSISVQVQGDTKLEAAESLSLTLSSPTGASLRTSTASVTLQNDDLGVRNISGTAVLNEKLVLTGAISQYQIGFEPATGAVKVVDQVAGRDAEFNLSAIEVLQFSDGMLKALPSVKELQTAQLGQAALGSAGLNAGTWAWCQDFLASRSTLDLAVYAVENLYQGASAHDMAIVVLQNLAVSPQTLGGPNATQSYADTVALLTQWFSGGNDVRAQALLDVATGLTRLEGDATYGSVALAYNDRLGAEWLAELAAHSLTLAGVAEPLVEIPWE